MRAYRGRAVAASAMPNEAARMREMLCRAGFSEIICVFDGFSVVREAQKCVTDLVLADEILPGLDAAAIIRKLSDLPLTVHPAVIVSAAEVRGVEGCMLKRPWGAQELVEKIDSMQTKRRSIPGEKTARAEKMLKEIGVPDHCGRQYLRRAIEMAWLDGRLVGQLTTYLYPAVAEEFKVDRRHVERSMRHAIDVAWRSDQIDAQYRLFGDTIDARRGSPTLGEMIARIADILRWEGKA